MSNFIENLPAFEETEETEVHDAKIVHFNISASGKITEIKAEVVDENVD